MTPHEAERQARIEAHIARVAREMKGPEPGDAWHSISRPPPRSKSQYQATIRRLNMMARNPGWSVNTPWPGVSAFTVPPMRPALCILALLALIAGCDKSA